jgi:hypothetical protein
MDNLKWKMLSFFYPLELGKKKESLVNFRFAPALKGAENEGMI